MVRLLFVFLDVCVDEVFGVFFEDVVDFVE